MPSSPTVKFATHTIQGQTADDDIQIGVQYALRFAVHHWPVSGSFDITLISKLFKSGERTVTLTNTGKARATAEVIFDKWRLNPRRVRIKPDAGYTVDGKRDTIILTALTRVGFAETWLTVEGADAEPESKALELFQTYSTCLYLARATTKPLTVRVESSAFDPEAKDVTIPAGVTTFALDVTTKAAPKETEVKLVAVSNCLLGSRSSMKCRVEPPTVTYDKSPVWQNSAAVDDQLTLLPGTHQLKFMLSYLPHPSPAKTEPEFVLRSSAFKGDLTVKIPAGQVSFTADVDLAPTGGPQIITIQSFQDCQSDSSISVAVKTNIAFQGFKEPGPYEDGQTVNLEFLLEAGTRYQDLEAELWSDAFQDTVKITFCKDLFPGTTVFAKARIAGLPPPHIKPGFEHTFILTAGTGLAHMEVSHDVASDVEPVEGGVRWKKELPRLLVEIDKTPLGPYKLGDKVPVCIKLTNGPAKHTQVTLNLVWDQLLEKVPITLAVGESEKFIELPATNFEDAVPTKYSAGKGKPLVSSYVSLADTTNCVNPSGGAVIRLELLQVSFHSQYPYRPAEGLFAGRKTQFTITHSYPPPAGVKVSLIDASKKAFDDVEFVLAEGRLVTVKEVTAKDTVQAGETYKIKLKPASCVLGKSYKVKLKGHEEAVLDWGGKRKYRIEPKTKGYAYEEGASVTLTVHLAYHPKLRANRRAKAPAGGCQFEIECPGFEQSSVKGTIAAGRSEGIVTAVLKGPARTQQVKLTLLNQPVSIRVTKKNTFQIEIKLAPNRRGVRFTDDVDKLSTATYKNGNSSDVEVEIDKQNTSDKPVVARISSTAFAKTYEVTFLPRETSKTVKVAWSHHSDSRQVVRVYGIERCAADASKGTRNDTTTERRRDLFSVMVNGSGTPSPVAGCHQVVKALLPPVSKSPINCAYPEFAIVERHGKNANVLAKRGAAGDGVFPVPETKLLQVIAGRKTDEGAEESPQFHRTEILCSFPGTNVLGSDLHDPTEVHPAIYLYRIDKHGNRVTVLPVKDGSSEENKEAAPGFWDVRFPILMGRNVRGLLVNQANLWGFEAEGSSEHPWRTRAYWKNKFKRGIPLLDSWQMLRQQRPRINNYEIEVHDCAIGSRKVRLEVYPSDEFSLILVGKPAPGYPYIVSEGTAIKGRGGVTPAEDLEASQIAQGYVQGTALNTGTSLPSGAAIPRLTVAALTQLKVSAVKPNEGEVFQVASDQGSSNSASKLDTLDVKAGDYVKWDGRAFAKTPKPGSLNRTCADLLELTPSKGARYQVKGKGEVTPGLDAAGKPAELKVADRDGLFFNKEEQRWIFPQPTETPIELLEWKDGAIRKLIDKGQIEAGGISAKTGDLVIWRATGNQWEKLEQWEWEKLEKAEEEDWKTPLAGAFYLELNPLGKVVGCRRWNDDQTEWEELKRKTIQELRTDFDLAIEETWYFVVAGGTMPSKVMQPGDVVTWCEEKKYWRKETLSAPRKWYSGWFNWKPAQDKSYRISPTEMATFDGVNQWKKTTVQPLDAKVDILNNQKIKNQYYLLTSAGELSNAVDTKDAEVKAFGIKDVVSWDGKHWVKQDATATATWTPAQFNERNLLLLQTFYVTGSGALPGLPTLEGGEFVSFDAVKEEWRTEQTQPEFSRTTRSIAVFDDPQYGKRKSGEDPAIPLASTRPFQSSYCFYPGEVEGELPETWTGAAPPAGMQAAYNTIQGYANCISSLVNDQLSISMSRNGAEDSMCSGIRYVAYTVAFLIQQMFRLTELLDCMPSMGYSASIVCNVMEGELRLRWGWKEFTNNQVFYWEQLYAKLMVLRLGLRVDAGFRWNVMVARAEAVIYVKIIFELGWEKAWERRAPGDGLVGDSAWTDATAKVESGASVILLNENFVSANMAVGTGLTGKVRWVSAHAGGLEYQLYFLGIVVTGKLKILGLSEKSYVKVLKKASPPGIPFRRGMIPGAANSSYFEIRATFGNSMARIIWDRNRLAEALEAMVVVQQDLLMGHWYTCPTSCSKLPKPDKPAGWPAVARPDEPGWDDQWAKWTESIAHEDVKTRKLFRHAVNSPLNIPRTELKAKLQALEDVRKGKGAIKGLFQEAHDRLELAEQKLDEIAVLEQKVDTAEGEGDERDETMEQLLELAATTRQLLKEVRFGEPAKPRSLTDIVKDIQWWCMRMEYYTKKQNHWGAQP